MWKLFLPREDEENLATQDDFILVSFILSNIIQQTPADLINEN